MTTVTIDLKKNADIADLLADMSPGDGVNLKTTIKSLDDQTAVLTVEEATQGEDYESDDDDDSEDMEDDDEPAGNGQDQRNPRETVPPAPPANRSNY